MPRYLPWGPPGSTDGPHEPLPCLQRWPNRCTSTKSGAGAGAPPSSHSVDRADAADAGPFLSILGWPAALAGQIGHLGWTPTSSPRGCARQTTCGAIFLVTCGQAQRRSRPRLKHARADPALHARRNRLDRSSRLAYPAVLIVFLPGYPFSSFFSSLRNRQSVPWAMSLLGFVLISPASCRRRP